MRLNYQTTIHIFQEIKFTLKDVIGAIREFLIRVRVGELVLEDVRASVDEPRVGDDTEFFHFGGLKSMSLTNLQL